MEDNVNEDSVVDHDVMEDSVVEHNVMKDEASTCYVYILTHCLSLCTVICMNHYWIYFACRIHMILVMATCPVMMKINLYV